MVTFITPVDTRSSLEKAQHLDANYWRVRRLDGLGSSLMVSAVVHASGCAPPLLYFLLYRLDA